MHSTRRTCSNSSSSRSSQSLRLYNTPTMPWVDLTSPALRGRVLVEGSANASLCAIGGTHLSFAAAQGLPLAARQEHVHSEAVRQLSAENASLHSQRAANEEAYGISLLCTIHSDPIPSHPIQPIQSYRSKCKRKRSGGCLLAHSSFGRCVCLRACVRHASVCCVCSIQKLTAELEDLQTAIVKADGASAAPFAGTFSTNSIVCVRKLFELLKVRTALGRTALRLFVCDPTGCSWTSTARVDAGPTRRRSRPTAAAPHRP